MSKLIIIKCKARNARDIAKYLKNNHNYDIPEIIETDINILNPKYIDWFNKSLM